MQGRQRKRDCLIVTKSDNTVHVHRLACCCTRLSFCAFVQSALNHLWVVSAGRKLYEILVIARCCVCDGCVFEY